MAMEHHFPLLLRIEILVMMSLFLELTMPIRYALVQMDPLRIIFYEVLGSNV